MIEALRAIVDEVVLALAPLMQAASDAEKMLWLLSELGWTPDSVPQPLADLATAGSDLIGLVGADPDATSTPEVFAAVGKLVAAIDEIRTMPDSAFPSGLDVTSFKATIGADLLDYLLVEYLLSYHYGIAGPLLLAGFIRLVPQPASGLRQQYLGRQVMWSAAGETFEDPVRGFRDAFDWNSSAPRLTAALGALGSLLEQAGMQFSYIRPADDLLAFVTAGATDPAYDYLGIDVVFDTEALDTTSFAAGLRLLMLSATASRGQAVGLLPYASLTEAVGVDVADNLTLSVQGDADFTKGVALILAPGQPVDLQAGFLGGQPTRPATIAVKLTYTPPPEDPERVLVGTADGSRLTMQGLTVAAGATLISAGKIDAFVQIDLQDALVAIKPAPGETDSFIGSLLGDQGISAQLSFGLHLSSLTGFHLTGSDGLRANLPVGVHLGPVDIQAVELGLDTSGGAVSLAVGATVAGVLGPFTLVVDHVGFSLSARFPEPPTGNLGPLDLAFGFLPPDGLGLQIDMGLVSGGGFISFDKDNGQYAGVLDVTIADVVAVKVIGVLDTKLPDGSDGFALLLIITFDLPPIQLGFGFTLNGVGGLGGVNRTMAQDALRAGLRAHTLDSILFPPDPVANAPQIISDIESFFPPQQGRYLFGPMLSVAWGTPTLLDFEVAVILEVPDPVRIAILGEINVAIPDPDLPLIQVHVDVLGLIDFGLQQLSIDGTMCDSYLLDYHLAGDMALRFTWGASPNFLFSLGGFNPKFSPPPGVPQLQRMSVSIGDGENPRLSSNSYLAVTSNSLQFGANVDAYASAGGFAVHGFIGFDALFIFSPFSFEIDFSAAFHITYDGASLAGIQLDASLSGPRPWHLHGDASFDILFFSVSASIDLTWGDSTPATLPSTPVLPPLAAALGNPGNWSVALPPQTSQPVTLRTSQPPAQALLAHPMGALTARETVVPLDITVTQFNGATPADGSEFQITAVTLNGAAVDYAAHTEEFAIAQFTTMSDADKLSAPSYEPFDAGVAIGAQPITGGHDSAHTVTYEERFIDDYAQQSRFGSIYTMPATVHDALAGNGAGARSPVAAGGLQKFATPGLNNPIAVSAARYTIASTTDLTARADILASATTRYQAVSAMQDYLAAHPEEQGAVQVVAAHEVAA